MVEISDTPMLTPPHSISPAPSHALDGGAMAIATSAAAEKKQDASTRGRRRLPSSRSEMKPDMGGAIR